MASIAIPFTSPVGRMVQGDIFKGSDKDGQGNLRTIKSGPNAGQPAIQYFVALAFAKNDPAWPAFEALIKGSAAAFWPALFPQGANGPCANPMFAFKIKDGDGVDRYGKSNASKPGFAGHWVVSFASSFAPKVWKLVGGAYVAATEDECKNGYFYQISGTVDTNSNPQNAGVYVNQNQILLVAKGEEIISGPTAEQAFGAPGAAPALPAGAQPLPTAGAPNFAPQPQTPAPAPAPSAYAGYREAVAPPVPAPAPVAPPVKQMTAKAGGATYESFIAQGWTDEAMITHGYLVA